MTYNVFKLGDLGEGIETSEYEAAALLQKSSLAALCLE
jgi:hypothetical protein